MVKSHDKFAKTVVLHRKVSVFMVFEPAASSKTLDFGFPILQNEDFR